MTIERVTLPAGLPLDCPGGNRKRMTGNDANMFRMELFRKLDIDLIPPPLRESCPRPSSAITNAAPIVQFRETLIKLSRVISVLKYSGSYKGASPLVQ